MTKLDVFRGLVRPTIALLFAGAVTAGFFLHLVPAEAFLGLVGLALGDYFRSRVEAAR